ncbi:DUF3631 domain-containing protein [Bradyrhizobium sp. JYMT SZCCT0428]|uniref:DUF3631 domain-containing protein n=1 Tax=Bradyrhizobium sp. JYMT SZCCT0428 TaxID=2807673 RepID=UPI001BAA0D49|nr:DUF3631 domain-containing protein [Bradyrhizobium sp. JYMT SZCCT0428]MBR1149346.1 DUF3631 domain-containing protein [Bradyrhizobium sp. JYMT SZCCT0428]
MNPETLTNAELDRFAADHDAATGDRVLRQVFGFLGRYVRYPTEHAQTAHALWIAHSHCMQHWHTTPRIAFMSEEKESGKTRALEVTEILTPGSLLSFNLSPAALVRKVAEGGHTILFDEIDALFGNSKREEGNLDVRSILNSGYKRGAKAYRCITIGKRIEVEELDSFAPVALAGLKDLPDTLASRAIIIRMRRRAPDEVVEQFRTRMVQPIATGIFDKIALWTSSLPDLSRETAQMPPGVTDRAAECWEPLLLIADAAGGNWPELARKAASYFVQGGKAEATSPGVELLEHIRDAFGTDVRLWTETLLQRLHDRPESPWRIIFGRPLDDRGLAKRLKGYGIKSCDVKIEGTNKKGYQAETFADAWNRYLPDLSATGATTATELINQNKPVAEVALVAHVCASGALSQECCSCGESGDLVEVTRGATSAKLHRECLADWEANIDVRAGAAA